MYRVVKTLELIFNIYKATELMHNLKSWEIFSKLQWINGIIAEGNNLRKILFRKHIFKKVLEYGICDWIFLNF